MECIDEAADIVKSPLWIAAQCLHIVLSMLTLVLSIKFVLMLKKSTLFNSSTVYLLLLFTAFANLHAIVIIGMKVVELIRDTVMTDACDLTRKTSDCMILTYLVLSCVVGMVFCQNILWIDRLVATAFPALHNRFCRVFAIILSSITTIIAFVLPFLLLRNDPYNDVVLTCMILPSGSAPQINRLFYSFVGLGLLALAALVSLYLINQRREKM
ncbi:integral membrane protein [Cooperia oncophora]